MLAIHPQARTTPAVRAEIARSHESSGVLAKRYGASTETEPPRDFRRLQLLSIRVGQVWFGAHGRLSLMRAFAMTMSLRMMATRATFFCFPAAVSRS